MHIKQQYIKSLLLNKLKAFIIGFAMLNTLWYLAYIIIDRIVMPSPLVVMQEIPNLFSLNIHLHFAHSLYRILAGLFFAMLIGLIMGILATNKTCSKILNPFIYFTYPIPRVAFLPVIMLVFGLRDMSKIIMIVLVIVFPVIIVVRDTVKDIPKETYNSLICLGASKLQMFLTVTLPWAFSGILSTLRISLGTSIAILFFVETYGTSYGMGFFILDMWQRINYVRMFAGIVVLSFAGFILFMVVDVLEEVFLRWKRD